MTTHIEPADAGARTLVDAGRAAVALPTEHTETLIVGAGQAGLSMAHHLARRGRPFLIVDGHARVGDVWRGRWDSLRLFTPSGRDGLPGTPFPGDGFSFPTKDELADYLEAYARDRGIPVRTATRIERLTRDGGRFVAIAGDRRFEAANVVVATGAFQKPVVPDFAPDLTPGITQLHSSRYRNPSQLQEGAVLIVGPGNSGADIAMELAPQRTTYLAGAHPGHIPFRIESWRGRLMFPVLWQVWSHVLNLHTPVGRRVRPKILAGPEPLIRVKRDDLERAGVVRVERADGVVDGLPRLADGRVLDVPNVIWATGYRRDDSWIDLPVLDDGGALTHRRGIVDGEPGLFVLGDLFQFAFNSHTVGGVARDAAHLADEIARRAPS